MFKKEKTMFNSDANNFHIQYADISQHWDRGSEMYTGGDSLMTFVNRGWKPTRSLRRETVWFAGARFIRVYYFELQNETGEKLVMPVMGNPFVDRYVFETDFQMENVERHLEK
jgi:nuclear transport factor 2 (NTF2) superfamily protein